MPLEYADFRWIFGIEGFFCGEEDQQMLFNLYPSIILLSFPKNENQVLYRGNKTTSPAKGNKIAEKMAIDV